MSSLLKEGNSVFYVAVGTLSLLAISSLCLQQQKDSNSQSKSSTKRPSDMWESHVPPHHGPLREIWPETLYILEAPGCLEGPLIRNMIIYRVPDLSRRLVIFNGIAVNESTVKEITALGTPALLVVPNSKHRNDARVWKDRFPQLIVICPEVAMEPASEVVPVDHTTQYLVQLPEWKEWIHSKEIDGWEPFETIIECELDKSGGGKKAMVTADLLFLIPYNKDAGLVESAFSWLFDSSVPVKETNDELVIPKVSRIARLFSISDWKQAENWYRKYASEVGPLIAVIAVGHGPPVVELSSEAGCAEALVGVADQLTKPRW